MANKNRADELDIDLMHVRRRVWRTIRDLEAENVKLREERDEAIKREMNTVMRLEMAESALQLANAKLAELWPESEEK
jgi:hypothetical protein